jgi:hypothetical protein
MVAIGTKQLTYRACLMIVIDGESTRFAIVPISFVL